MKIVKSVKQMARLIAEAKLKEKKIGFVPTMGFLHEGHLSLLRKSKKENDFTVLSIFVNPKQFGPNEDFTNYPRDFKRDESLAQKEKVDIIFYPSVDDMYPKGYLSYVEVSDISNILCGKFRPGHFRGVTTIVAKLLNIVQPDTLYLGQKDAQQAAVLTKMVKDLNFPMQVKILPTVREKDGFAMSSRNAYLNSSERSATPILYQSLLEAKKMIKKGERNPHAVCDAIHQKICRRFPAKIEYVECVDAETLSPLGTLKGNVLIALAAWFGKTRLMDNMSVKLK